MNNQATIQRQYDEIIATDYDLDSKKVLTSSFERAIRQFQFVSLLPNREPLRVLDIGLGTGSFLAQFISKSEEEIHPFGLDISEEMLRIANMKIPHLEVVADTANNLEKHFLNQSFDLICTHFVTGFVPMNELAPQIWSKLEVGGYWSFIGQSLAGYPVLTKEMDSLKAKLFYWLSKSSSVEIEDIVCNPKSHEEVIETFKAYNFEICYTETFEPKVDFNNLDDFLDFGYRGGWLTPFIETYGLHKTSKILSKLVNILFFPFLDNLSIEIALVRKVSK